ncbi:MAG TPA: tRNA uridine-5-carboxymethylaminomethyl(34) synthesis GTPase MnmE [Oligoflexia bacterium]|nr:tRNA uridine-5-carboxymethylaminomethyl(34) synthesis GTPase MnmE [Oligoflexia bacterium]HMP48106.1 tRNA uridine-5-carboxymethylaminomethyl(34) synthesis GTPase MnmE [Oligoflexia bacterium]
MEHTIIALGTPPGKGAIAVLRISGSKTSSFIINTCKRSSKILTSPRSQVYTELGLFSEESTLISSNEIIDHVLACFFPSPNSFTGEDVLELSVHGSSLIIKEILNLALSLGIKLAEPGEFTKRAFLNGKMDLLQAEAVADIISAESKSQARIAREQLEGKLSRSIELLREPLLDLLAEIEAFIDFPEEDISPETEEGWIKRINEVEERIIQYLSSFTQGRILREGASLVLAGVPNAGKSSLMNRLLGEERAIVTSLPGTTRDRIEERVEIEGILVRLSDTAGIVSGSFNRKIDLPEQLGIEKSWSSIASADIVLFLFDPGADYKSQSELLRDIKSSNDRIILLVTKIDINSDYPDILKEFADFEIIGISSKTGEGIGDLRKRIYNSLTAFNGSSASKEGHVESALITSERHYQQLKELQSSVQSARTGILERHPSEYIAFEIRQGLNAVSEILGVTHVEDILDRIFSRFCIGK